jgi:peptide chain release factor subunit 1
MTKQTFLDGNYLNQQLKDNVLGVKDLSYTGEFGLKELVEKGSDLIAEEEITKEKEIVNKFLEMLAKNPNKVTYGEKQVRQALEKKAVDTLILSESLSEKKIEELSEKGESTGANVEIISTETSEGVQLKELSGIAAILRYEIHLE